MASPLFSIILPTYNRAHMLSKAIASVRAQTCTDWELVVVDDGSTDDTEAVVAGFADERIRYHWQENAERSAARNKGIQLATGQYVCFLDSDDLYLPEALATFQRAMADHIGGQWFIGQAVHGPAQQPTAPQPFSGQLPVQLFFSSMVHSQQVCVARSLLEKYRFDTALNVAEDLELWLRMVPAAAPRLIAGAVVHVVDHQARSILTVGDSYAQLRAVYKALFARQFVREHTTAAYRRQLLSRSFVGSMWLAVGRGQRWTAARMVVRSFWADLLNDQTRLRVRYLWDLLTKKRLQSISR